MMKNNTCFDDKKTLGVSGNSLLTYQPTATVHFHNRPVNNASRCGLKSNSNQLLKNDKNSIHTKSTYVNVAHILPIAELLSKVEVFDHKTTLLHDS